ncbi:glycosyltransferase [Lysinimonas soli]|uniref:Glycosyltransferase n=1 Tax=Lysinimonas soli TaxID=1074233 RepID=A0ABW0NQ51_9MICO
MLSTSVDQVATEVDVKPRERILILSAGVGAGHNSAAAAVKQACLARDDVDDVLVVDVLQQSSTLYRDLLGKGYFTLVENVPWLVDWGYDFSDLPFKRRGPIDPWTRANSIPAINEIKRFKPTAMVCTHFLPAQLVASLVLRGVTDAKTAIVTTDYDFQGLWLTSAFHAIFVAREEGRVQLTAQGVPADRVAAVGIPISAPPSPAFVRDPDAVPMLLISAGTSGGDYAAAVVRQTMHVRSPFRATVVCGRNDQLRRQIEQLVAPAGERYRVLGYTSEMPELLSQADLFIGKPGGLSASECMAAGLPMVLVNPIPGQEVRNGDYLMEQGAAVRCNTPSTIGWKIDEILREPGRLQRMQAAAQRIGRPMAAADVLTGLLDGPDRPLVLTRGAQKSILTASARRLIASDLSGPKSLVRLVDPATDSTVALLRAEELADLQTRYPERGGYLVLQRDDSLVSLRWEARRLLKSLLRGDAELPVRVEWASKGVRPSS